MTGNWLRPGVPYVPGQTTRPEEGWADDICASVRPGMCPGALAETSAFRHGLFYLEQGYFWEAHEVLEPVWMALPEGSAEKRFVQALIQLANACLKQRMGRPKAVARLCEIVRALLANEDRGEIMGVHVGCVRKRADSLAADRDVVL